MGGTGEKFSKWRFSDGWKRLFLRLAFANTVFHKRKMLPIFYAEHPKIVIEFLSVQRQLRAHHGWAQRKIFKLNVLRRFENAC